MRTINEIIIHCSATPEGREVSVETIRKWHKRRGFSDIGYHYVIHLDGAVEKGRPIELPGAHCKGRNDNSIGVCYIGGTDNSFPKPRPKDTRTESQKSAMKNLVTSLMKQYGLTAEQVHGHNEYANRDCPSFDVKAWKKEALT